jgi:tRNA A-37 threonylcarbamoyl transferase component Bud32
MNESTLGENPVIEEAFAAFVQAQENGQTDAARQLMRDHPGLAEEVAMFYALCARVPQPWDSSVNSYDGQTIGDFELLHELGRGGEGVVYKARQKSLQRVVAVKVMRHERFAQDRDVERFRRDSTLLASLHHPNIVQIYFAGESETGPYFAMELMADGSLKQKLADGWLPTPKQAGELVRVLAEAMQCAHDKEIVHRDLKPANILLQSDGTPKIVDFGLAKKLDAGDSMTQSGAIVGTASYMAPEQAKGQRADFPCDIYGLGAVLYELLTGRPPFVGASLAETLDKVRRQEPLPIRQLSPTVPFDLEVICLKCLDKDPLKRYAAASELAADLRRFLRGEPILARLPGIAERAVKLILRHQYGKRTTTWGWTHLLCGCVNTVGYLAQMWCIATEQRDEIFWTIFGVHYLSLAIVCWGTLRGSRIGRGERLGIDFLTVAILGPLLVPIAWTRPEWMELSTYRLSLYPLIALLHGVLCYPQGSIYWGGYYLYGAGFVGLALVMKFFPAWSPIVFGLSLSFLLVSSGLFLLRLGRTMASKK